MKNSLIVIAFWMIALILGASAEECLPKFFGLGFPVLLVLVAEMAWGGGTAAAAAIFAIAAGGMEDALCALPPMTSVSFFLAVAVGLRWLGRSWGTIAALYPCYQLWLEVWTGGFGGGVFKRLLGSVPIGLVTAAVVCAVVIWCARKAAVDERG